MAVTGNISQESRPAWGAWIEILITKTSEEIMLSRAPHGARGLKSKGCCLTVAMENVAPRMGRVD